VSVISKDKVVTVTYRIAAEDGETLEQVDTPVSYLHGRDSGLFEKVEAALDGKAVGDLVSVSLSADEAFGAWDPVKTFSDAIENVPPEYRKLGAIAEFMNEDGESLQMTVTHVDAGTVTLDGNHPLAGKDIAFHVRVVDVRDATPDEIRNGVQQMPSLH
jgi:FKBP-type peptidyl-prolyl cis-trans isomerase SlyD